MTAQLSSERESRPVVVLITSTWAGPSRPAPTVLRELSRRWGSAVAAVLFEDPTAEAIAQLDVTLVPTWLRLESAAADTPAHDARLRNLDITGSSADGHALLLTGPWIETHRRTGALPKHVIDAEFGQIGRAHV